MPGPSPSVLCSEAADSVDALCETIVALNAANPITPTESDAVSVARGTAVGSLITFANEAEQHGAQSITIGSITLNGPDFARRLVDQINAGSLGDADFSLVSAKLRLLSSGYAGGQ